MNETDEYILGQTKTSVWSGFFTAADVHQLIDDILEEDADEEWLRAAVQPEFERKRQAEKTWPASTDCDRLDAAFAELNASGVIALHNTGTTMSDGHDDVGQALHERGRTGIKGYCFYHDQDVERAVNGDGLWLAFGDLDAIAEQKKAVGEQIAACLQRHGLQVNWDGEPERRMSLPGLDWKRRGPTE